MLERICRMVLICGQVQSRKRTACMYGCIRSKVILVAELRGVQAGVCEIIHIEVISQSNLRNKGLTFAPIKNCNQKKQTEIIIRSCGQRNQRSRN